MNIVGIYSFNRGQEIIQARFPVELEQVKQITQHVDSAACQTKTSFEKSS